MFKQVEIKDCDEQRIIRLNNNTTNPFSIQNSVIYLPFINKQQKTGSKRQHKCEELNLFHTVFDPVHEYPAVCINDLNEDRAQDLKSS